MSLMEGTGIKKHFFTANFRLSQMCIIKIDLNYAMTKEILEEKVEKCCVCGEKTIAYKNDTRQFDCSGTVGT